jgi:predicted AlkP superfamily pyrophosphatase or phosphodiesterase
MIQTNNPNSKIKRLYVMKRFLPVILLFLVDTGYSQHSNHVILISIDGFRPDMYEDKNWPAPNLRRLMNGGVYAKFMKSVFPSYTYPSHTAMLTGALPARSGIVHNIKNENGEWYWFTSAIRVPTLWNALKKLNLSTAAIEWPVSVDASITYNIPEIWNTKDPNDRITKTRKYATRGLIEEIENNASGKLDGSSMRDGYLTLDENSGRLAAYIFNTYKPNLLCVHFAEVDGMEHEFGRDGDSVRLAVAAADRAIGDILEAIERSGMKDSTTVLIVGDHGFSDIHTVLRPNVLLQGINAKFKSSGGSAFLYPQPLKGGNDNSEGIIKTVKTILNGLPNAQRKLFRIIERKELDKMGADSSALLALAAIPGVVFSSSVPSNAGPGTNLQQNNLSSFIGTTKGGHHGYDPDLPDMYTGFIAAGAGINEHKVIEELCVTDIAPLIAKLLGIEFKVPDGKLIPGIVKK